MHSVDQACLTLSAPDLFSRSDLPRMSETQAKAARTLFQLLKGLVHFLGEEGAGDHDGILRTELEDPLGAGHVIVRQDSLQRVRVVFILFYHHLNCYIVTQSYITECIGAVPQSLCPMLHVQGMWTSRVHQGGCVCVCKFCM